ncbi:MAG TPA: FAD-dependent oxidoreductase [Acidobacteriaceae bacterium]|nr:FAD-dependent oxidoreductase [Acidobacteriaceae bacterium]
MKTVFVVGAGPAGLFAAQKIAMSGHQVFLFNRDIKPGGLAEYGIYPLKDKMKFGLRKQFAKVLSLPNVHYFGHVTIGEQGDLTLADLRAMNPAAMVFACGAQGYNALGLPGEECSGVYSAKDFVYGYNQLPPYATRDLSTGKRIAIVGMGNVAADIMRWLLRDSPDRQTEEVIVVARRGPYEAKFDKKEIEHVEEYISRQDFLRELDRIRKTCEACNQDMSLDKLGESTFPFLTKTFPPEDRPKLTFRFLSSPKEIVAGPDGRIEKLIVTENNLALRADGSTQAKATDRTAALDVDTLIFAIGDKHDPAVGLPMGPDGYATKPGPESLKEPVYEAWDPALNESLHGIFVVGWARRASTGLVGIARHDGEEGAKKVLEYLQDKPDSGDLSADALVAALQAKGATPVTKQDIEILGRVEQQEAQQRNLTSFKYSDDDTMLQAIQNERETLSVR